MDNLAIGTATMSVNDLSKNVMPIAKVFHSLSMVENDRDKLKTQYTAVKNKLKTANRLLAKIKADQSCKSLEETKKELDRYVNMHHTSIQALNQEVALAQSECKKAQEELEKEQKRNKKANLKSNKDKSCHQYEDKILVLELQVDEWKNKYDDLLKQQNELAKDSIQVKRKEHKTAMDELKNLRTNYSLLISENNKLKERNKTLEEEVENRKLTQKIESQSKTLSTSIIKQSQQVITNMEEPHAFNMFDNNLINSVDEPQKFDPFSMDLMDSTEDEEELQSLENISQSPIDNKNNTDDLSEVTNDQVRRILDEMTILPACLSPLPRTPPRKSRKPENEISFGKLNVEENKTLTTLMEKEREKLDAIRLDLIATKMEFKTIIKEEMKNLTTKEEKNKFDAVLIEQQTNLNSIKVDITNRIENQEKKFNLYKSDLIETQKKIDEMLSDLKAVKEENENLKVELCNVNRKLFSKQEVRKPGGLTIQQTKILARKIAREEIRTHQAKKYAIMKAKLKKDRNMLIRVGFKRGRRCNPRIVPGINDPVLDGHCGQRSVDSGYTISDSECENFEIEQEESVDAELPIAIRAISPDDVVKKTKSDCKSQVTESRIKSCDKSENKQNETTVLVHAKPAELSRNYEILQDVKIPKSESKSVVMESRIRNCEKTVICTKMKNNANNFIFGKSDVDKKENKTNVANKRINVLSCYILPSSSAVKETLPEKIEIGGVTNNEDVKRTVTQQNRDLEDYFHLNDDSSCDTPVMTKSPDRTIQDLKDLLEDEVNVSKCVINEAPRDWSNVNVGEKLFDVTDDSDGDSPLIIDDSHHLEDDLDLSDDSDSNRLTVTEPVKKDSQDVPEEVQRDRFTKSDLTDESNISIPTKSSNPRVPKNDNVTMPIGIFKDALDQTSHLTTKNNGKAKSQNQTMQYINPAQNRTENMRSLFGDEDDDSDVSLTIDEEPPLEDDFDMSDDSDSWNACSKPAQNKAKMYRLFADDSDDSDAPLSNIQKKTTISTNQNLPKKKLNPSKRKSCIRDRISSARKKFALTVEKDTHRTGTQNLSCKVEALPVSSSDTEAPVSFHTSHAKPTMNSNKDEDAQVTKKCKLESIKTEKSNLQTSPRRSPRNIRINPAILEQLRAKPKQQGARTYKRPNCWVKNASSPKKIEQPISDPIEADLIGFDKDSQMILSSSESDVKVEDLFSPKLKMKNRNLVNKRGDLPYFPFMSPKTEDSSCIDSPASPEPEINNEDFAPPKVILFEKEDDNNKSTAVNDAKERELYEMELEISREEVDAVPRPKKVPRNFKLIKRSVLMLFEVPSDLMINTLLFNYEIKPLCRVIVKISTDDIECKPVKRFNPMAPILSEYQVVLLRLLILMTRKDDNTKQIFLKTAKRAMLAIKSPIHLEPLARLHVAYMKYFHQFVHAKSFIFCSLAKMGNLAVPYLYFLATSWSEVFVKYQDACESDRLLMRAMLTLLMSKELKEPEYYKHPLISFLTQFHQFPTDMVPINHMLKEMTTKYLENKCCKLKMMILIIGLNMSGPAFYKEFISNLKLAQFHSEEDLDVALDLLDFLICENYDCNEMIASIIGEWLSKLLEGCHSENTKKKLIMISGKFNALK